VERPHLPPDGGRGELSSTGIECSISRFLHVLRS
jgi:hypothetical protein